MAVMYLDWRGQWKLPPLNGIASTPMLRADGTILSAAGYDAATGYWLDNIPDVAMLVPETTSHEAVLQTVKQSKAANLENVELFDVFRGQGVPDGQKSLAYAFTYRAADKTLTDADVNAAHEKILAGLQQQLSAVMR